jgi:type I restriction enzyme M protein
MAKLTLAQLERHLFAAACRRLVLDLLRIDLATELDQYVTARCGEMIAAMENWWDKYQVTLRDIERKRGAAPQRLGVFLRDLEYVR